MTLEEPRCNRRGFLGLAVPACAATCLALKGLPLAAQETRSAAQAPPHKFDAELPRTPTYRQVFAMQYRELIPLTLYLTKTLGRDKTIELLKAHITERAVEMGKRASQRPEGNDFAALKKIFTPGTSAYGSALAFEVVESTDTVHEIKVTECLWAKTWLDQGAGEQGFAAVCYADYAFAGAFNPNIELVRDKTLMQGHDCCNHRYLQGA